MILDLQHLVLDHACLCLYVNHISYGFSHQGMAYGSLIGDLVLKAVGLCGAYDENSISSSYLHPEVFYLASDIDLINIDLVLYYYLCVL